MDYFWIVEVLVPFATGGLMWQVWNIRASLQDTQNAASKANNNAWESSQKLDALAVEIARLREEHKEIQGNQQRAEEGINKFADAVSSDVRTIMRDHGEHEVGQAKIEAKLDELIRSKEC